MTTKSALPHIYDYSHLEPLPDPPRKHDMQQHISVFTADATLQAHFANRNDVLICGSGYLRHDAANEAERLAPDLVVAFGVNPDAIIARNGYVISEVGKPPDFVLEVASKSTGVRDYTVKRAGYAGYGVSEYWRFDRTGGRFHDAPLAGDALVNGEYAPLAIARDPAARLWGYSSVLGLELWWDDGELRFRNPVSGEFLLNAREWELARLDAEEYAESQRTARLVAEEYAESQRNARLAAEERADAAESRIAEMEAEMRHLRGE